MNIAAKFPYLTVLAAIDCHKRAFADDDALYDDDGVAISEDDTLINAANEQEVETFRAMVKMPCANDEEVQAKLRYLLEGVAAHSKPIHSALHNDRYVDDEFKGTGDGSLEMQFLRSLVLPDFNPLDVG